MRIYPYFSPIFPAEFLCSPRYRRYFLNFIMDYERQKIHSESKRKCPQKVTAVLRPLQARIRGQSVVYWTDSEQEVQNRRFSPSSIFYNSFYNSLRQLRLQLQSTTPRYYYYYQLPWKVCLPRLLLLPSLPRSSSPSEPRTSRSIISRIVNIV
jgi:hypothetical protein